MLGAVTDVSYGILSVQPKFADGTPVENIEDTIILSEGQEIKAWTAIAAYLNSMEDTDGDGISNVPQAYASFQSRKIVEDSRAIGDLIRNPNRYAFLIVGVVLAVLVMVILLVLWITKGIRKLVSRKGKQR